MPTCNFNKHLIELAIPKQNSQELENDFNKFAARYCLFLNNNLIICLTDNPMGHLSFMGPEIIEALALPVKTDNLILHLNTFHRKTREKFEPGREQNEQDLDVLLQHALKLGIRYLLCVSGDGSERLPRLTPQALGYEPQSIQTITSVELLKYIREEYAGQFTCGVAFNQYEPVQAEMDKLKRKAEAGAAFVITQPVITDATGDARIVTAGRNLETMLKFAGVNGLQVILEVWLSQKFAYLMPECIGVNINLGNFDPWTNLKTIHTCYPEQKLYLCMIFNPPALQRVQECLITAQA